MTTEQQAPEPSIPPAPIIPAWKVNQLILRFQARMARVGQLVASSKDIRDNGLILHRTRGLLGPDGRRAPAILVPRD